MTPLTDRKSSLPAHCWTADRSTCKQNIVKKQRAGSQKIPPFALETRFVDLNGLRAATARHNVRGAAAAAAVGIGALTPEDPNAGRESMVEDVAVVLELGELSEKVDLIGRTGNASDEEGTITEGQVNVLAELVHPFDPTFDRLGHV
jgi:hypothetical protein